MYWYFRCLSLFYLAIIIQFIECITSSANINIPLSSLFIFKYIQVELTTIDK